MNKRASINISMEAKGQLDSVKADGQTYDGVIRDLVKFWKDKKREYLTWIQTQRNLTSRQADRRNENKKEVAKSSRNAL